MQLVYVLVALAFIWVARSCFYVWHLTQVADPKRNLTHFAQHQVVLIFAASAFGVGLCFVTASLQECGVGSLSRWWAVFDVLLAIILLAQLKNLEVSLSAGRQG